MIPEAKLIIDLLTAYSPQKGQESLFPPPFKDRMAELDRRLLWSCPFPGDGLQNFLS
jgi:hypothetical protein